MIFGGIFFICYALILNLIIKKSLQIKDRKFSARIVIPIIFKCNPSLHSIGLYRVDELACFGYTSGPQADRIRKDFIKIFKEDFDFSITCETNLKAVNFLDVTLNLITGKYQPDNKPDKNPLSNHPPNIIKNFPDNISKRINTLTAMKQHLISLKIYTIMH